MVSAACPACRILVVEGNSPSFGDLATAENTAARLGAPVISNSYGTRESGFSMPYAKAYDHRGHTVVVSSGDSGFGGANFPAMVGTVTAVGATQLARASTARGWTERVWNSAGGAGASGCSAYVAKPAWQHDTHCAMRTTADVAAVGANVAVYSKDFGGWVTVFGTSISAPLIAGVYALAGNAATIKPGYEYAHARWLYDITTGNNDVVTGTGAQCGGDYLCVAKTGYDGPTGLGTPDGTAAF
jgi:subtilase family serine protease